MYGTTVQHGFLTLGLANGFLWEIYTIDGFGTVLNDGLNKVRFPAGLKVNCRSARHGRRRLLDPSGRVDYNVQTRADQTVMFMDAMGVKKAHLVGNSLGGPSRCGSPPSTPSGRPAGVDGQLDVGFPITEGLDSAFAISQNMERR